MFILFGLVVIVISVLLTLIVLIQNPKGGVLSSTFGSMGNQILGANRSTDVVEKITWYLAGGLMVLSVASLFIVPSSTVNSAASPEKQKSEIEEAIKTGKGASTLPSATLPNNIAPQQGTPAGASNSSAKPEGGTLPQSNSAPAPEKKK